MALMVDADQPHSIYAKCLPEYLREVGYKTIHAGKAHFAAIGTPATNPENIGLISISPVMLQVLKEVILERESLLRIPISQVLLYGMFQVLRSITAKTFLTEALTLEANKAISSAVKEKKPFFLYMAHYALHTPFAPDERFIEKYRKKGLPEKEAMYAAIIEGMDKSLGDIMTKVKELGQEEDTVVMFMSDNGGLSAHARNGSRHTHNKPLSVVKALIAKEEFAFLCWSNGRE